MNCSYGKQRIIANGDRIIIFILRILNGCVFFLQAGFIQSETRSLGQYKSVPALKKRRKQFRLKATSR